MQEIKGLPFYAVISAALLVAGVAYDGASFHHLLFVLSGVGLGIELRRTY